MAKSLAEEPYVSLATFRRDGRAVQTPVWCVGVKGRLYVFTEGTAGKVKRVRATKKVRVAPCGVFGAVSGDWVEGTGRIVADRALIDKVYEAFDHKYGWQMRIGNFFSRLTRRFDQRAILELVMS